MKFLEELQSKTYRSPDRVLVLEPIDGQKPKSSFGTVDPRLFTGENKLHAVMDKETCHWRLKYDFGGLPEDLKQSWTSFSMLKKHADGYYAKRNLKIKEVKD